MQEIFHTVQFLGHFFQPFSFSTYYLEFDIEAAALKCYVHDPHTSKWKISH